MLILAHEAPAPRIVGGIGIHGDGDGGHELGYWLNPGAWGRGYATEAGRAVVDIARYGLGLQAAERRPLRRQSRVGAGCCASSASSPPGAPSSATAPAAAPRAECRLFGLELDAESAAAADPCAMAA